MSESMSSLPMNEDGIDCQLANNQRLIWLGQQKVPDIPMYEVTYRFEINGSLAPDRFCHAFSRLG